MRQYVYLGILVVFLALVATSLYYRAEATVAHSNLARTEIQLTAANQANEQQRHALEQIAAFREQNDKILTEIYSRLDTIGVRVNEQNKSLANLEKANVEVREYLNAVVPDDLRRLLNGTADSDDDRSNGTPTANPPNAVQ